MTTIDNLNPARVLRDAADYLRRNGWTKDALFAPGTSEQPKVCALGAIEATVAGYYPFEDLDVTNPERIDAQNHEVWAATERTSRVFRDYLINHLKFDQTWKHADLRDARDVITKWNDVATCTFCNVYLALRMAADRYDVEHGEVRR